jgi:hypothetical protein
MAPAAILFLAPALVQASTISLVPSSTTVAVGDVFELDLNALGLPLGAYDVTFSYNPLLAGIDPNLVTFDTHLGGPDNSLQFATGGLDTLELTEVSFLTNPADLQALQTDGSYPLSHIQVTALAPGTVSFDFVPTMFTEASDYNGNSISGVTYLGATVTIQAPTGPPPPPPADAPEPGAPVMLLSGLVLVGLGLVRRRPAKAD